MSMPDSHSREEGWLHRLKHYLPSQAPLKDFIHHNTLHAFQHMKFHDALRTASRMMGYRTYLRLEEFRAMYASGKIAEAAVLKALESYSKEEQNVWKHRMLEAHYDTENIARIGQLREVWKTAFKVNLDKEVHTLLFRLTGSYLDQGVAMWPFPHAEEGFLASIRTLEQNGFGSFFKGERARQLLLQPDVMLEDLLQRVVGNPDFYETYLFDQQFAHPGWSGMVSVLEDQPQGLLDTRKITLKEFIHFELLLEVDALDQRLGEGWKPLGQTVAGRTVDLFEPVPASDLSEVYRLWQEAFEIHYHDQVLAGILQTRNPEEKKSSPPVFQAMFCIDDREGSMRRHLERLEPACRTYGTPGFFGVAFYFQPEHGKFFTKLCPAPVTPKHLIREIDTNKKQQTDLHFTKGTHSLLGGWLISQTMGLWSAFRLLINIFFPAQSPASVSSFTHMDKTSRLTIENKHPEDQLEGLQIGFTVAEMTDQVEALLRSIGLVADFAPLVYLIGHGASSANNTHYAGYDCGACSGRPGSVNARVMAFMANHSSVRQQLNERGIQIPVTTRFLGGLHDTTRDEIEFYDEDALTETSRVLHQKNMELFKEALSINAWERSRRFSLINSDYRPVQVHQKVKLRSVSLFEPRPEYNHATNALCLVGRRAMSEHLFLDRRAFMNSFDYRVDPEGKYLLNILRAAAPVCGGINLEYYFSRVDNYRLGAGTKLPHNVMGLIGVANGLDGDLRTGLPAQMVEIHDPIRLLLVVEHNPEVVLKVIQSSPPTYEWFENEWVHLVVVHPEQKQLYRFKDGKMLPYVPAYGSVPVERDVMDLIISTEEDFPVCQIKEAI